MENGYRYWNDETVVQGIWNLRDPFKSKGCMLVPLTTAGAILPPELANDVLVLDEALPTREELEAIVKQTYADAKMKPPVDGVMEKILDSLVGLAAFPSEQTLAMCLTKNGVDTKELWNRKCQVIEQTPGLSIWKGVFLEKVIGVAKSKMDSSSPVVSAGREDGADAKDARIPSTSLCSQKEKDLDVGLKLDFEIGKCSKVEIQRP